MLNKQNKNENVKCKNQNGKSLKLKWQYVKMIKFKWNYKIGKVRIVIFWDKNSKN